jgi:hypothetical protein
VASVLLLLGRLLWRRSLDASAQSAPSPTIVKAESMQVFLLASAVLVPLAVLVLGRFENESSLRFVIPAFYCPALAIVAHVLERLAPRASRARLALALAGLGALFSLVPVRTDRAPFRRYFATPLMECLERWSDHYSLDRGLGFHWESHLNTVASGGRLIVRSIAGDGHMFRWANTIDFYSPEATTEPFTFLAVSERLDREGLTRRFGRPERILHCSATKGRWSGHARKGIDVWVYDGDGAKRLTEEMRRQYARARAAPRRSYPRKR